MWDRRRVRGCQQRQEHAGTRHSACHRRPPTNRCRPHGSKAAPHLFVALVPLLLLLLLLLLFLFVPLLLALPAEGATGQQGALCNKQIWGTANLQLLHALQQVECAGCPAASRPHWAQSCTCTLAAAQQVWQHLPTWSGAAAYHRPPPPQAPLLPLAPPRCTAAPAPAHHPRSQPLPQHPAAPQARRRPAAAAASPAAVRWGRLAAAGCCVQACSRTSGYGKRIATAKTCNM